MKAKPKAVKPAFGFKSESELFMWLWVQSSSKKCAISGECLLKYAKTSFFWSCFAHLLPKGLYGKFRLRPDNIWLVSPKIHTLIDTGTEDQRAASGYDFTNFYKKAEELKQEYLKL